MLSSIFNMYVYNVLFIRLYKRILANDINVALFKGTLPQFVSASDDNIERKQLISCLINNLSARKKLLELQKGYYAYTTDNPDEVIYQGFSVENAKSFIEAFEECAALPAFRP